MAFVASQVQPIVVAGSAPWAYTTARAGAAFNASGVPMPLALGAAAWSFSPPPAGYVPPMSKGLRTLRAGRQVPQKLQPIDQAEVDNLTADMSTVLDATDPIISVAVTCEARVGVDAAPAPLLYGAWQVHGLSVRQRIKGALAVPGVTYLVRVQATSASGRVALAAGFIKALRLA